MDDKHVQKYKMSFIFNALEDGWSIKKRNGSYIFTKRHEGKKEMLDDSFMDEFVRQMSEGINVRIRSSSTGGGGGGSCSS